MKRARALRRRGESRAVLRNFTCGILGLPDSEIYTSEYVIITPHTQAIKDLGRPEGPNPECSGVIIYQRKLERYVMYVRFF